MKKLETIYKRNLNELKVLLKKYKIKTHIDDVEDDLEEFVNKYNSVYIHKDFKQKRIRLLGIKKIEDPVPKTTAKTKTVQLFVLTKSMVLNMPADSVFDMSQDLALISFYFEELKLFYKIKEKEREKSELVNKNTLQKNEYEKMLYEQ